MSTVGQIEKKTQQRVVNLFHDTLDYDYLGNWADREGNRNIEEKLLRAFLTGKQGQDNALITRALFLLDKATSERGARRASPCETPRGRHHLEYSGLGKEPNDGVACEVDSRECEGCAGADNH
jgi:hypothetical protein